MDSFTRLSLSACVVMAISVSQVASKHMCDRFIMPLCKDAGYNVTYTPTMFTRGPGDYAATLEVHPLAYSIAKTQCSPATNLLFCAIYAPMCVDEVTLIPPCRSLCTRARAGCLPKMSKYGLDWPSEFDCDQFPSTGECLDQDQDTGSIRFGPAEFTPTKATYEQPKMAEADATKRRQHVDKSSKRISKKLQMENLKLDNTRLRLLIMTLKTEEEKLQLEYQYLVIKIRHLEATVST